MTDPDDDYQPNTRRGGLIVGGLLVLVIAAIVAVVKLWPDSMQERQDAAVDACKTAVEEQARTDWRKLWQESAFQVAGPDKDHLTVTGEFSTKDSGFRSFTCTIVRKRVVKTEVQPG